MNNTLSKILIFAAGAAIGSVVTWKVLDAKYAQRAEQEIEEMKDYYEEKHASHTETDEDEITVSSEEVSEYVEIANRYTSKGGGTELMDTVGTAPYVIHPDDFDTLDDYDTISLSHYTDGILADEDDNIIEDVDGLVGRDYASHFGEFEDDAVYIRNERLKIDYEILQDYRPYSDVVG